MIFLLSYPYNSYYNKKSAETNDSITSKLHQLDNIKNINIPIGSYLHLNETDSLPIPESKKWKERKRLIIQFEENVKSLTIEKEYSKGHIIHDSERINLIKNFFLFLLILCFPIRYVYYVLRWSIKTIKRKE